LDLVPVDRQYVVFTGLEANLIYFASGWCAYVNRDRLPKLAPWLAFSCVMAALAAMWLYHHAFIENTADGLYHSQAWMLWFPLLMSAVALIVLPALDDRGEALQRQPILIAGILFGLGVTSYSVYVLHMAVYNVIRLPFLIEFVLIYAFAALVFVI